MGKQKTVQNNHLLALMRLCVVYICFMSLSMHSFAQSINITGVVKDGAGKTISNVSVVVKGSQIGVSTNSKGVYAINVPNSEAILEFSFVGFTSVEEKVSSKTHIDVVLKESADKSLEDIVVVGYGTQKKRDVTGAIASVSSKQISERAPQNVFEAMQGQVSGVVISQESSRPGGGSSIRIRGIGTFEGGADPLYVVDGAQGVNIDGINPNDIETIEILKDAASAAIYGSAGGNGVVIITTKKGKEGRPKVELRYLNTFGELSRKVTQANATERRLLEYKRGTTPPSDSLNPTHSSDNDFQDILSQTAIRSQGDFSISGGAKNANYFGSIGIIKDKGIIINSWADILRARFNVDFKLGEKISLGNRIQASYSKENRISDGNTLAQAIQRIPYYRVRFPDGRLVGTIAGRRNPLAEALLNVNDYEHYDFSIYNYISYNFLKDLKFTIDANLKLENDHNLDFSPKLLSSANPLNNLLIDKSSLDRYWLAQGFFNYNKTFASKHTITGVLGVSAENGYYRGIEQSGTDFVTESVLTINSAQIRGLASPDEKEYFKNSIFGRLGYSYKGRYLFNSNFRADASSRFGKENRWGYFPSASIGWRFSDEKFMEWTKNVMNEGKFRISYGIIGNDKIGAYDAQSLYVFGDNYYNGISGVSPSNFVGNPKLTWETVTQLNIGTDFSFFKNRLTLTMDYYDKVTKDLLYTAPLSFQTGFNSKKVNVGSIQNKGFEFAINASPIKSKTLQWNISYNMSFNVNTVKKLYGGTTLLPVDNTNNNLWLVKEGGRLGDFYGYVALGVYAYNESNAWTEDYKTQLTPVFENNDYTKFRGYTLNGKPYTGTVKQLATNGYISQGGDMIWQNTIADSSIDDNDRVVLGNVQPKWVGGLTNTINYKDFSLSFAYYASWGGKIYNNARSDLNNNETNGVTPEPDYIRESWWKPGDITRYPIAKKNSLGNARDLNSLYLEDASFIRLRNARLTYNLPSNIISKIKLSAVSVYIFGNNLLTWTNYSWFDPEISLGSALTPGNDNGRYPKKREYGGGININF